MKVNLLDVLISPESCLNFNAQQWSKLIAYARANGVLGRLYFLLSSLGKLDAVPTKPLIHLRAAYQFAQQQQQNTQRELDEIASAFQRRHLTPVILKGAAYLFAGKKCAKGRTYNDIDVLTFRESLQDAEISLMVAGWIHKKEDEYDKEYYRNWTHEIQPMIHNHRHTVVDLHHNILPPTNKYCFDARRLNLTVDNDKNIATLDDVDMFIHCALHLFTEGEFSKPLRDITDLSMLLDDLPANTTTETIVHRAKELGVADFVQIAIALAIPLTRKAHSTKPVKLNRRQRYILIPCYKQVLFNNDVVTTTLRQKIAATLLYIRGHLVRMPLRILLPHLLKKWLKKSKKDGTLGKDWA